MILLLFYTISFFFLISATAKENSMLNNRHIQRFLGCFLIILSFYSVYITDVNYIDRYVYNMYFMEVKNLSFAEANEIYSFEPLFHVLSKSISYLTSNIQIYYVLVYAVFFFSLFKGVGLILKNSNKYVIILLYLNYTFYYAYVFNGIRQGIALTLIILLIGYGINRKPIMMMVTAICAFLFHYSSLPLLVSLIIIYRYQDLKIRNLIILFIFFSMLFITDLNKIMFSSIDYYIFGSYTSSELIEVYGSSNQISFLLFISFFLLIFSFPLKEFKKVNGYVFLYKAYIVFSIYFLAFGYIAYSNRLSIYSWFLIPLIMGIICVEHKNKVVSLSVLIIFFLTGLISGVPYFYNGSE